MLLLDLNLNGQDGFTILEHIRPRYPSLKVIIFTMCEEDFMIEKARKSKANGYLLKNSSSHELVEVLNHVISSIEFYLPQALLKQKRENEPYRDEFIIKFQQHNYQEVLVSNQIQQVYRILQEALNNIVKHAQATPVDVQLFGHEKEVNITIEDNGKGFNPQELPDGLGLNQMKIRTESLGQA